MKICILRDSSLGICFYLSLYNLYRDGKELGRSTAANGSTTGTYGSNGNLNNSDKYTRAMHDIFQYELCHFSQSTVLVIITKIQTLCITFVSIVCAYRFLTSLNFLAASVTLFGNVVAGFAMSGPTETLELEQIAEEIRGHINMDDNNKSK